MIWKARVRGRCPSRRPRYWSVSAWKIDAPFWVKSVDLAMSALFPLCPRKPTFIVRAGMWRHWPLPPPHKAGVACSRKRPDGLQFRDVAQLWRAHHGISPPHIFAACRGRSCVAGRTPHGAGAGLSVAAGAHRRRLSRRRGHRHPGAPDGSMAVGSPRPAIHHREPLRRQR